MITIKVNYFKNLKTIGEGQKDVWYNHYFPLKTGAMKKTILIVTLLLSSVIKINAQITSIATATVSTPVGSNISGIAKWSEASTWVGGVKPTTGDTVNIPANSVVVLDENVNLSGITINGKLIVDISQNILLRSAYVMVMGANSYLEWGTETEPYLLTGRIVLYGDNPAETIPGTSMERKMLVAMMGGQIELHGKPKKSWTQLNATADIGKNTITLKEAVDWEIGDEIVIASTDYAPQNAEVVTITGINGTEISIDKNLTYMHFGKLLNYKNGTMVMDQRAEVGLLTRNLKIQGTVVPGANAGFNASVMVMVGSQAHIEGVEFKTVGQRGKIGRYPFHWHIAGDVNGQYIKNCSIRESSNRAVVVHGTNRALVEGVVAYNHVGHGFFIEDGDEELNIFKNNLGVFTRRAAVTDALEPIEAEEPATFWITNPNNRFIGNAAAGSEGAGYWLIPVTTVLRTGAKPASYSPRKFPLLEFDGNRAHSNTQRGIMIEGDMIVSNREVKINNQHPLLDVNGDTLKHVFKNFTTFKSRNCIWTRAGVNNTFINGSIGEGNFMAFLSFNAYVENTLFVGRNENTGPESYHRPGIQILGAQMYNGSTDFKNIHLADFDTPDEICIGTRQSSGKYPNFTSSGVTFENVPLNSRVNFNRLSDVEDPSRSYSYVSGWIDEDGSITNIPGGRMTPRVINTNLGNPAYRDRIYNQELNLPPDLSKATLIPSWNAYITTDTRYTILQNWAGWGQGGDEESRFVYSLRSDGPAAFDVLRRGWDLQQPIILDQNLTYFVQYHEIPNRLRSEFKWTTRQNDHIIAGYPNVPSGTTLTIPKASSLNALKNRTSTGYFLKDNMLYIHYFANQPDGGLNSSVKFFDYSAPDININFNPSSADDTGRTSFVTLADFEVNVDSRATLSTNGNLSFSSITGNGSNPADAIDHSNSFSFSKDSDANEEYVDYTLSFERQVWGEFNFINLDFTGSPAEVIVMDKNDGETSLGIYDPSDSSKIRLNIAPEKRDEVIGLKLRFNECTASSSNPTINLKGIYLNIQTSATYSTKLNAGCTILSVDEITKDNIAIYPNPTKDSITISGIDTEIKWTLYTIQGAQLNQGNSNIVDLKKYPTGTYLLQINGVTKKIIKN